MCFHRELARRMLAAPLVLRPPLIGIVRQWYLMVPAPRRQHPAAALLVTAQPQTAAMACREEEGCQHAVLDHGK